MIAGTRWPPSNVVPLPSRSGTADPLCDPFTSHGPLSEVKTTRVRSSRPSWSRVFRISPTDQSISMITSPYSPRSDAPANRSDTYSGRCGIEWGR